MSDLLSRHRRKLRLWIVVLGHDMSDLYYRRDVYRRFAEIVKASPVAAKAIDFVEWVYRNYVDAACVALRRFNDRDTRSVSIRRVLVQLRDNPGLVTRRSFLRMRRRPKEALADIISTFDRLAGRRVDTIGRAWCESRLSRLDRADATIRRFVNKRVAHKGTPGSLRKVPKHADLDAAIQQVDRLLVDVRLALTGEHFTSMAAATLHPWQDAFTQAWLPARRSHVQPHIPQHGP
jgi:hypothetical protein